jgi:sialic acid synthase SpsE
MITLVHLKEGLWKGKRPYELFTEAAMPWDWQKSLSEYCPVDTA